MQAMAGHEGDADAAIPYHRLYVGNLYYNLTADDIRQVFEPFGELAFVEMPMEPHVSWNYCHPRSGLTDPFVHRFRPTEVEDMRSYSSKSLHLLKWLWLL
jgi:RNA recognition motif-containing protein